MHENTQKFMLPKISSERQGLSFHSALWCVDHINMGKLLYIYYKMWDKITYPFPDFNDATFEVWEWINDFTPHMYVITYPRWMYRSTLDPY